jgi:DNA-binding XRE family transcriptional regulator
MLLIKTSRRAEITMFGIGKKRSKFGKFLDKNSITQQDLSKLSGVNRNSISRLTQSNDHRPSMKNGHKIIKTLKKAGYKVDYDDFWSM